MGPLENEELAGYLRARGLRVTAQRLAVYRAASELPPHSDVDAIAVRVRDDLGRVSTQAVYDALRVLTSVGLLRRIEPAGSPARFEPRVGDNHHHVVCRVCGIAQDLDCAVGSAPCLSSPEAAGFLVDEAEITFWGLCPTCRAQVAGSTGTIDHDEEEAR